MPAGSTNGRGPARPLTLSVIVAATDRPATLERSLAGIRAAQRPEDELLVVDSPAHLGPAAARNSGASRATGDVLVFVDSDVVPHRDALNRIRDRLGQEPELEGLFGSYDSYPPDGGVVSTFRNLLPAPRPPGVGGPKRQLLGRAGRGAT